MNCLKKMSNNITKELINILPKEIISFQYQIINAKEIIE